MQPYLVKNFDSCQKSLLNGSTVLSYPGHIFRTEAILLTNFDLKVLLELGLYHIALVVEVQSVCS